MPKVTKILHGDVELIAAKIKVGIASFGKMFSIRDQWKTEAGDTTCILQVYEKKSIDPGQPHYTMSLVLLDTGEEIRLYATTSGGANEYIGNPYPEGEGELTSVLNTILNVLDDIIM